MEQTQHTEHFSKLPPQAVDVEEAVIGALMLESGAFGVVADILKPEHFYKDANKLIYSAITTLYGKSEPIDILTVTDQLKKTNTLDLIGGAYHILELTDKVHSAANIEQHARIILEKSIKRSLIEAGSTLQQKGYDDTVDVFELMEVAEKTIIGIHQESHKKQVEHVSSVSDRYFKDIAHKAQQKQDITGVPCGILSIDQVTHGWQEGDLIIIAARPGMGKTGMALTFARNTAVNFKKGVAIFSLEMTSEQLFNRLLSIESEIDSSRIKHGKIQGHEWTALSNAKDKLDSAPIFIDDTPALSILELRAKAMRLKAKEGIGLIIVDYAQLMTSGEKSVKNRDLELGIISRGLKALAKDLRVPVIALCQLSRAVETRADKRPQLSDLRESGNFENDADIVAFLYRPEYYNILQDDAGNSLVGVAQFEIAKHRHGALHRKNIRFVDKFTKFMDLASPSIPPPVTQTNMFKNDVPY